MKNNFFSIVLINQKSKQSFSINLSKWKIYLILALLVGIFLSYIIFLYQIYYQIPTIKQHSIIHNNRNDISALLRQLKNDSLITDSTLLNTL